MARKKKKSSSGPGQAWLVTFSDLVTLLLTFFVLLLSMSTLDKQIITLAFSNFSAKVAFLSSKDSAEVSTRIEIVKDILKKPWEVLEKKEKIKDLLFPNQELPKGINKSTLNKNLKILQRPEGVALVLSDKLLFSTGSFKLSSSAEKILRQIKRLLYSYSVPVNISGHTDDVGQAEDNYVLSAKRARSVINYFMQENMPPERFSISAYGEDKPISSNKTPKGRQENRRVEILLKNVPYAKTFL